MSNTAQTPDLNFALADQVSRERVYGRVVLTKLAHDYGLVPQSPEEAVRYVRLAEALRHQDQAGVSKEASARLGFLDRAEAHLGLASRTAGASEDEIKQAAALLARDEDVRNAALVSREALRRQLAAR